MEEVKKRKVATAVTAVVAAAAIALTGTFAWQSISQTVVNEAVGITNPGGRLHDDFDGTNKDIYVENFTSEEDGQAIFARVRLDEYMETGREAGENRASATRLAVSLVEGADINDETTWTTHIHGSANDPFHEYWAWTTGGQTTYMPTFNKNKDSLAADINGTYEGTTADDDTHFDDYIDYSAAANASKTANAVYDADDNDEDEGDAAVEGANITTVEETHAAKHTQTGTVMTMAEWKAAGSNPGAYWVYDTDGWAYWAQPIEPGTATGLLLDGIELSKKPGQSWYYSINVVAQFVTVDDWGADDNTGFFDSSEGSAPTEDALALLGAISGKTSGFTMSADGSMTEIFSGDTRAFSARTTMLGEVLSSEVTWSLSGNTSASTTIDTSSGQLTVAADETAGTSLTVTATNTKGQTASTTLTVRNLAAEISAITPGSDTQTLSIDGREWFVLANDGDKALIWAKYMEPTFGVNGKGIFSSSNKSWETSSARTWLNETYLDSLSLLKNKVVETTISTAKMDVENEWVTTQDKVFLLSEADVFGTAYGEATSNANDYTYGTSPLVTETMKTAAGTSVQSWSWLRSPFDLSSGRLVVVRSDSGIRSYTTYSVRQESCPGVLPAMWVSLASE
jgi:hypothetical protein